MEEIAWVEKYRPKKLNEIIGQIDVIKRLKTYVRDRILKQHLLFAGSAGTGKTATALALAMELFGVGWRANVLELNASDERGIDVIRNKVKSYANVESLSDIGFKVILLDEADALTVDAQNALRRIMEKYSRSCKFILTCNYSSKIIEPIQSRSAVYRFKRIDNEDMKRRLLYICEKENLKISNEAVDAIVYISEGDMRKAINDLQTASLLGNEINIDNVYKSSGFIKPKEIEDLIKESLLGNFEKVLNMLDVILFEYSMSGEDLLKQMYRVVRNMNLENKTKVKIVDKIGDCDFRLSEGANESIQLKWLLANLMLI